MSRETIIADASCLIVLQNIRQLSLLQKLFGEISVTPQVQKEYGFALPEWIEIKPVQNEIQQKALNLILDEGEASSISLYLETRNALLILETGNALLIIDEKKGRRVAEQLNIKIIGTLGIILLAKEKGFISSVEELLEKLENAGFRISPNLKARILEIQ